MSELMVPDFRFHFNTVYGPICHRLAVKNSSLISPNPEKASLSVV